VSVLSFQVRPAKTILSTKTTLFPWGGLSVEVRLYYTEMTWLFHVIMRYAG